jgi:lipopolysaccharide transport system ATP-binding protein
VAAEQQIPGLSVTGISKKFCKNLRRSMVYGLTDIAGSTLGIRPGARRLRRDEFWAVKGVSLSLNKGDMIGLIGPNGSGKTTLLRLLAGIFPPDDGAATLYGRVAALLTIGAGFHPHLTVRDNVYINGTILGMTRKEIDEKFDAIIAFSGIGDFIQAPVAALSDGMYVRLGFSIALAMKPDIFLIDEVLAVSDREFREKCIDALKKIARESAAIFVSHNMEIVLKICNGIVVMNRGAVAYESKNVAEGIAYYNSLKRDSSNNTV